MIHTEYSHLIGKTGKHSPENEEMVSNMTPELMAGILYDMAKLRKAASDESEHAGKKEILDIITSALRITGHMVICELPGGKYTRGEVLDMYKRLVAEHCCESASEDPGHVLKEGGIACLRDQNGRKSKQNISVMPT